MTDELFTTPETLSPRLRWMREHGITTNPPAEDGDIWLAVNPTGLPPHGYGDTEDDALVHLAKRLGIKLWNE